MRRIVSLQERTLVLVLMSVVLVSSLAPSAHGMREGSPIVIAGALLQWGDVLPNEVVAFAYRDDWHQIPVQVDERDIREFAQIYGSLSDDAIGRGGFGSHVFEEVYCDPDTFTGLDSNPTLDANDEIVFMAHDAGTRAETIEGPVGTQAGSGVEIALVDPLSDEATFVYLFLQDGTLDPSAGVSYVDYDFHLLSGEYRSTYNTAGNDESTGARNEDHGEQLNPEDSIIRTTVYERHWSYRWTCDRLSLFGGSSLVEREDYWISPGACSRNMGTFNAQEGAFIANISGPVRAIRSFLGANSGPLVQVDRIYYEAREDVAIYVRVHPRSAVGMFYVDHTVAAIGMTYFNDLNPTGVMIDGKPDRLEVGPICWELVAGDQGSMIRLHEMLTDIDFERDDLTLFYVDDVNTAINLCQACLEGCREPETLGDDHLIGASGVWNTAPLPNTDPSLLATQFLTTLTTLYYGEAGWTPADAMMRQAWADIPMGVQWTPWPRPADPAR